MITLFDNPKEEIAPVAIVPNEDDDDVTRIDTVILKGTWWRVIPRTGADVCLLQMLEHRTEKFAPHKGDGVLVSSGVLLRNIGRSRHS